MWKFRIPADEVIQVYETVFLLLFAAGLISFVVWMQFQYPQVSITIMGMGVLLLWLAKQIRKKRDKMIETENKELTEELDKRRKQEREDGSKKE